MTHKILTKKQLDAIVESTLNEINLDALLGPSIPDEDSHKILDDSIAVEIYPSSGGIKYLHPACVDTLKLHECIKEKPVAWNLNQFESLCKGVINGIGGTFEVYDVTSPVRFAPIDNPDALFLKGFSIKMHCESDGTQIIIVIPKAVAKEALAIAKKAGAMKNVTVYS